MSPAYPRNPNLLCHCLQVSQEEVREAITRHGLSSVREVSCQTGAGEGCMACHRRIIESLRNRRAL